MPPCHPLRLSRLLRHATLLGLLVGSASSASADDAQARALAVQLFDEGDRLMRAQRYAEACEKLAESNRLDPQLGALLYLAECYEANGQLASAWGGYREGEEIALRRGDDRAAAAGARARALEPRLSRMVLELPRDARTDGYAITRNGMPVAEALWDTAVAIDAGLHRIEVRAPGREPWSSEVRLRGEARRVVVRVPVLARLPPPPLAEEAESGGSQRIAAIAVGGLGLVGLGVGGFFALNAKSSFSDSAPLCNPDDICHERGTELRRDAKRSALVATVASIAGSAAIGVAMVLWFSAPDADEERPEAAASVGLSLHADGYGVDLAGSF